MMNKVILYCRPGFEKESAAEIVKESSQLMISGFAKVKEQSGYVIFECTELADAERLIKDLPLAKLIFTRQMIIVGELLKNLAEDDRISPIMGMLDGAAENAGELRVEVADTNESKPLLHFCRKLTVPLRKALRAQGMLLPEGTKKAEKIIHVFFIASGCCYVGYSYRKNSSPYFMGIHRLKFPTDAPSRSTLKLEEAFYQFIPENEHKTRLASGMTAVDLGACPGGWTYQLVQRGIKVYAVDNGSIDERLLNSGLVTHVRQDGFHYIPPKGHVNWLVCDMVEKPAKVTQLIVDWFLQKRCEETIFNLKLPMKKRYQQICDSLAFIEVQLTMQGVKAGIQAKQLYHDREEVTVHIRRY